MRRLARIQKPDVLIIGAGPAGSTYATVLARNGKKVLMIDAGPQFSQRPGRCVKNTFAYQRDLNQFSFMIQGFLHPLSVAPGAGGPDYETDPIAWRPAGFPYSPVDYADRGAINPRQDADKNLGGESVAFGVGGMMQHWTAATPRHHPDVELYRFSKLSRAKNLALWDKLYTNGEALLGTNNKTFDTSIRNTLVREALRKHYAADLTFAPPQQYAVQNLPMAVRRGEKPNNNEFVFYTGTDNILSDVIDNSECSGNLEILTETRVKKLLVKGDTVIGAELEDLMEGECFTIEAGTYVVASGAVMSAWILWNSGIALDVVGRYIIEHPIAFTQIVLRQEIIDSIDENSDWKKRWQMQRVRDKHAAKISGGKAKKTGQVSATIPDPLRIPQDDPPPNVWIPVSETRPWHCQIHKDAFHYGALPPGIDDRLIVDLRWFCVIEPRKENRVIFEKDRFTSFGTAQPTFDFTLSEKERARMHLMMQDMQGAASALGAYMPGSEPKFMPKGLALHIQGTTRMGGNPADSVVDENLKVHQLRNLYVGGNGVIPTGNASNPTLTNVSLALKAAHHILGIAYP
ncbi:MAG TPA: GMC oxidoreductase [Tepidisphaeraceae bacterium]|nr:GMC oxidoreductase [Tepidisphaeraceae bacterium]